MGEPITIELAASTRWDKRDYGIVAESKFVYHMRGPGLHNRSHPHRVQVWDNAHRPNTNPDAVGAFGMGKVGPGAYIGPDRKGTDDRYAVRWAAESVSITNSGTNTGTVASGQVYAPEVIAVGDVVELVLPGADLGATLFTVTPRPVADPVLVPVTN